MHNNQSIPREVIERIADDRDLEVIAACDKNYDDLMMGGVWRRKDFRQALRAEDMAIYVAETRDGVDAVFCGFMVVERYKRSYEIHRIAINPVLLRIGVGSVLVHALKKKMSLRGVREIACDVPQSNIRAQLFFKSLGFKAKLPSDDKYYRFVFTFADLVGGRS